MNNNTITITYSIDSVAMLSNSPCMIAFSFIITVICDSIHSVHYIQYTSSVSIANVVASIAHLLLLHRMQ